jgi:hypothetical protein
MYAPTAPGRQHLASGAAHVACPPVHVSQVRSIYDQAAGPRAPFLFSRRVEALPINVDLMQSK